MLLLAPFLGLHERLGRRLGEAVMDFGEARLTLQTLRFVQSLPKREKVPFATKFSNADPLGECIPLP